MFTPVLIVFLSFLMFPNVSISKESEKTFVKVCTSRCNTLILVYLSCNRLGDQGLGLCTFSNSSFSVRKKLILADQIEKSILLFLSNPGVFYKPRGKSEVKRCHYYDKVTLSCYDNHLSIFRNFWDL